jgi:signal transduction histidine kinase
MFGYVSITKLQNRDLIDKAGREGLIANKAYRDLRFTLTDFFKDVANEFFSTKTGTFGEAKERVKARKKLIDAQQKRSNEIIQHAKDQLKRKLDYLSTATTKLETVFESAVRELENLNPEDHESIVRISDKFVAGITELERQANFEITDELEELKDEELNISIFDYKKAIRALPKDIDGYVSRFKTEVNNRFPELGSSLERKNRIKEEYQELIDLLKDEHNNSMKEISESFDKIEDFAKAEYENSLISIGKVLMEATRTDSVEAAFKSKSGDLSEILVRLNRVATQSVDRLITLSQSLNSYLKAFLESDPKALLAAQTGEIRDLREQVDKNLGLVQIGLSVEIIDHDLNKLYSGIKAKLKRFRELVEANPTEARLVEDLTAAFQHIEQRYKLMSPLYRSSIRRKEIISGERIRDYIMEFLQNQIEVAGVTIKSTPDFLSFKVKESPAVVLPVFVNVIDNSIYWIRKKDKERRIQLDRFEDVLTVNDTGTGIHETLLEKIFESLFSTQPSGRGLGLYVARANLERYGHEIWATNERPYKKKDMSGACICVKFNAEALVKEES